MNPPDLKMILQGEDGSVAGDGPRADDQTYQSEDRLERFLIEVLSSQGYEYLEEIKSEEAMRDNLRLQMEKLNSDKLPGGRFSDDEWQRFWEEVIANRAEGLLKKSHKLRQAHSFRLESGEEVNLRLLSADPSRNTFQVVNQIERKAGRRTNRYDVTILVNGLPLVHIELKRRGVALREAFNQVNRYRRDSFWSETGLFNYVQLFVISNGTLTRYYSNTVRELSRQTQEGHRVVQKKTFAYQFTSSWATPDNKPINDLGAFARSFLEYRRLSQMLYRYCVLQTDDIMRALRPYQVHAVEAIERRVQTGWRDAGTTGGGGYIWHTTGSGKTLTSFVAATLLTNNPEIDKVLFVVDRKDLDYQTMLEFNKFAPGSVDGTNNTRQLQEQLHSPDQKIIVTTIQKLDRYTRKNKDSDLRKKRVVLIFDECHRSQFGVFHKNITRFFGPYHLFGFTGTPIFAKNASKNADSIISVGEQAQAGTTEAVFGDKLHHYTIVNAINDRNVLPFKVDYVNTVRAEEEIQDTEVPGIDTKEVLESDERVASIVRYIIENHDRKTRKRHFNALLATSSVEMAQKYYREFECQQAALQNPESPLYDPYFKPLRIATIYSYSPNDDDGSADGDINSIDDEALENTSGLSQSARDQLEEAIEDYNALFQTNFDAGSGFQDYYKDVSKRMKSYKDDQGNAVPFAIDILIVVNMMLTGYDAQTLNTLYTDKNLRLHGLLQAFSRTNRILNSEKSHGEIVCFRNLRERVDESISLFGDEEASGIVLLQPYREYLQDYKELVKKLEALGEPENLTSEKDKEQFIETWSALLRTHNVLKTFDQFEKEAARLPERKMQDGNSFYLELREQFTDDETGESILGDVVFETELVRSIEVNIDYILELVRKYHSSNTRDKTLHDNILRSVEASPSLRNKRDLLERFISQVSDQEDVDAQFERFISKEAKQDLLQITRENGLSHARTRKLINRSLRSKQFLAEGTSITNLNEGQTIGFGKKRNEWKAKVSGELLEFFERYTDFIDSV